LKTTIPFANFKRHFFRNENSSLNQNKMTTKTLIGGLIAGVVLFLLGFLIWVVLLKDTMANCSACMRPEAEMNMVLIILSNLVFGLFLAWVLSKWPGVNSMQSGLQAGALFMAFLVVALDLGLYATTMMYTSVSCVFIDIVINIVMGALAGAAIGWWFGRPNPVVKA
jgi:hypothetical protein